MEGAVIMGGEESERVRLVEDERASPYAQHTHSLVL